MKIAIVIPGMEAPGGVERVVSIQANYWVENNHEVTILIPSNHKTASFYTLDKRITYYTIERPRQIRPRIPKLTSFIYYKKLLQNYKFAINNIHPDVIISTLQGEDDKILKGASVHIPIIGVNHISIFLRSKGSTLKSFEQTVKRWTKFDAIIALNRTDMLLLKQKGCNSFFIPNPCSFDKKNTTITKSEHPKYIVCVGRLDYIKGQDRLLKVWKQLAPKYPNWTMVLVGDGNMRDQYEKLEIEYNIQHRIKHIYNSNDVQTILQHASIFAFTSRTECCPMALIEAFSCALPVVCYDCESGPRDFVENFYNGFLIPNNNTELFISKLETLITNTDLRKTMSINALSTAQRVTKQIIMAQWDDLLASIVKNTKSTN
ncbi:MULTISPECIES: glycosyltransferase family 4 protein [Bacteroides]|uniref:glycosyltransferase family 4 protein n=2 Tax=Bacteroides TaxID=816 RepID=UPI00101C4928|nr:MULTISPECIES: glycosyltransferase family 4 protein [Bacteroides]MBU8972570.1 glycosyltransferase family 4 protein [Bacteroides eggerthii]MBU8997374.1 glycosyltransferase family 4 protein [Bacteroides eggerthii]MCG4758832.1 glycosyltransferase family 4 protein [Bacteroides eggerthii]